jgi:tetratricopeptide (TPR) repeat protein
MKIRDQYSVTTYGKDIEEQIAKIETKISEVEAARYIAQLRTLTPNKDAVEIIRIVELLKRRYARTDEYERNYETIELAEHMGRAYTDAFQAVRALRQQKYETALALFDKAMAEYPDIGAQIKSYLEECYYEAGLAAFNRRDFRTALSLFTRYRRLPPKENKLHELYLMRAYYEVGKLDYQQGNLEAAEQNLFVCSRQFERDAEFNYIFGSVLMGRADYQRAVEYFSRYFQYASADADKRYYTPSLRKRGYSQAQLAAELEGEVRDLVLANAVYRPLIDEEAIRAQQEAEAAKQQKQTEGKDKQQEDKNTNDEDNNSVFDPTHIQGSLRGHGGPLLAQADAEGAGTGEGGASEGGTNEGDQKNAEEQKPAVKEAAIRRTLGLIVEVLEAESNLIKEDKAAVGDPSRRQRVEIMRTRMIEDFQQRQANLGIDIDRENRSKLEIIKRIEGAVVYLTDGVKDLNAVNTIAGRNRDLDRLIEKLDYKCRMFSAAYTHLVTAYQQDLKIQADAYELLGRALKQFSGWPDPRDIGRSLRAIFMMKPGTEQVAEGLRALLKAFDVETDLDIILRSGGEAGL